MIKVLFVCHGNICRSPMAEFVFRFIVSRAGLQDRVETASAATSTEEIGSNMYAPARKKLEQKGVPFSPRHARQITHADYDAFDYLVGMDERNIKNMNRAFGGDPEGKISKLLSFCGADKDIADPWYTGDFETTYREVVDGCTALLEVIQKSL